MGTQSRVEDMLRGYKEEVDTLREALNIAARTVAETSGYPMPDLDAGEEGLGDGGLGGGESAVRNVERAELQSALGAGLEGAASSGDSTGRGSTKGKRLVIADDGSYKHA